MKTRQLLFSTFFVASTFVASAQELDFTTTGSCASYITWNTQYSRQADSIYEIKKAHAKITVDGVADAEYANANTGLLRKIAHEMKNGSELDLSNYPQDETDLYTTMKALWTDDGVYMFFDVKDDYVRYQNNQYQWENDGIELFFAKAPGDGKIQLIIPAMVGTPHPTKPAALDLETGSAVGSDPDYKVFGYDYANWDESLFFWAIKKTATGYTMEVYLDKDIVTNGNSLTNFGKDLMFAGDVNVDESDLNQDSNDPPLYRREGILGMMSNSIKHYAESGSYGYFKMVDDVEPLEFTTTGSCASYITYNNRFSHQADSVYIINNTLTAITIDGVEGNDYANAVPGLLKKIAHERTNSQVLDLSMYPQDETDLYTSFKALWSVDGVYMFFDVKDDYVRYQNTGYPWENDGIEFYFAKEVGAGKIQIIIPSMVGTTHPTKPAALDFESGSAVGSDPDYKVFGYDAENWDESLFKWAIKRTSYGYTMEVYMDKDIVTNGNSLTNYGKDKMFAGDINVDEADLTLNTNDPALFIREGTLCLLGNSNQEYASSANYGYFKMIENIFDGVSQKKTDNNDVIYDSRNMQVLVRNSSISTVSVYNSVGQIVKSSKTNNSFSVSNFDRGMYFVKAIDAKGNILSVKKIIVH